jgi:hypothetical protein
MLGMDCRSHADHERYSLPYPVVRCHVLGSIANPAFSTSVSSIAIAESQVEAHPRVLASAAMNARRNSVVRHLGGIGEMPNANVLWNFLRKLSSRTELLSNSHFVEGLSWAGETGEKIVNPGRGSNLRR